MDSEVRIKIALLAQASTNDIGGASVHSNNLITNLSKDPGINLHVICISKNHPTSKVVSNNVTYHYLNSPKISKTLTGITTDHRKIITKVNEIKPDIVHAQILGAPYGLAAMKLARRYPTVLTVHTLEALDSTTRKKSIKGTIHDTIWKFLEKRELRNIENFILVSRSLESEVKKRGATNIWIVPNGISEKWFDISNNEVTGRVLFVGRIAPIKGLRFLIEAFKQVKLNNPQATLHLVGPIQYREYYRTLTDEVDSAKIDGITFRGPLRDTALENEYSECSVFVLPSKMESFGIVLLEAGAAGKPVVATDVGGISLNVTNGSEGYLVRYGDVAEFASKIDALLKNKDLRGQMGQAGKNRASKVKWDVVVSQTIQVYKDVIADFQRRKSNE